MGQPHTYVKGKGSHQNVPPPLASKVDLFCTAKKINTITSHLP